MRVSSRQYQRAQGRQVEPERQLAANDAAGFAGAAAGDDLHAADMVCGGIVQESLQGMERGLGGFAVEIEGCGWRACGRRWKRLQEARSSPAGCMPVIRAEGGLACGRLRHLPWRWAGGRRRERGRHWRGLDRGFAGQEANLPGIGVPRGAVMIGVGAGAARHAVPNVGVAKP